MKHPPLPPDWKHGDEPDHIFALPRICCGTCQYWTGSRQILNFGRRLRCSDGRWPCPWRLIGSRASAPYNCNLRYYKP